MLHAVVLALPAVIYGLLRLLHLVHPSSPADKRVAALEKADAAQRLDRAKELNAEVAAVGTPDDAARLLRDVAGAARK